MTTATLPDEDHRSAASHSADGRGPFRRIADYLFGFDFFLSYAHSDGIAYAEELSRKLEGVGFKVFLDKRVYVAGDDLPSGTSRRIRMSRKFILLARPYAMISRWVYVELQTAMEVRRTPVVINFNQTLEQTPSNNALKKLLGERIYLHETQSDSPSPSIVDELLRGFQTTRQETLRLRTVFGAAVVFGCLMIVAVCLSIVAYQARGRAESNAKAAETAAGRATREAERANKATLAVKGQLAEALLARGDSLRDANRAAEALPVYGEARQILRELQSHEYPAIVRQTVGLQLAPLPLWVRKEHSNKLQSVAIAPDGIHALSAGLEGTLHYWHLPTSRILKTLSTPQNSPILRATLAGEGNYAIAICVDYRTRAWHLPTGDMIREINWDGDITAEFEAAFNSQGTLFAVGGIFPFGPAGPHEVFDLRSRRRIYKGDVPPVTSLALSDDGAYLAVADFERGLRVVDLKSREPVFETSVAAPIQTMAFSPDAGTLLASSSSGREIQSFDLRRKEVAQRFSLHQGASNEMRFLPDGKRFISVSDDGFAVISEVASGEVLHTLRAGSSPAGCLAIDPRFNRLLLGCDDGTVSLWQLPAAEAGAGPVQIVPYDSWLISAGDFSPDGRLAAIGQTSSFVVRDQIGGGILRRYELPDSGLNDKAPVGLRFSADGKKIHSVWSSETPVFATFEVSTGKLAGFSLSHFGRSPQEAAISPDGQRVLLAGNLAGHDMPLSLFDTRSTLIRNPGYHTFKPRADEPAPASLAKLIDERQFLNAQGMAFSPDGRDFAFGTPDHKVRIWNIEQECPVGELKGHTAELQAVAFTRDGRRLLTGGIDRTLRLWDRRNLREIRQFHGHNGGVSSVALFAADRFAASGGYDRTVRIWDVESGREVILLGGFPHDIYHIAVQADGMRILVVGGGRVGLGIRGAYAIWDLQKSQQILTSRAGAESLFKPGLHPASADVTLRLGEYYAAHDQWDWAADLLLDARRQGAAPDPVTLMVALRRAGRTEDLDREIASRKSSATSDSSEKPSADLAQYLDLLSQDEVPAEKSLFDK